jgi:phosphoribosylformylglycinamidine (FGAM) synthase PurS component
MYPLSLAPPAKEGFSATIYPNPAQGKFAVSVASSIAVTRVQLLNVQGQTVKEYLPSSRYDVSTVPRGTYFVSINSSQEKAIKRLIIE